MYLFEQVAETLSDYNKVYSRIRIRLDNIDRFDDWNGIPHKTLGDMAIWYSVDVPEMSDEDANASAVVSDQMLKAWGRTIEEIHVMALLNTQEKEPESLKTLDEVIQEMIPGIKLGEKHDNWKVLTNKSKVRGASAILYPGVRKQIEIELGESYYIIPSSIHEMIIVPKSAKMDGFAKVIVETNMATVEPKERLSNNLYWYDALNDEIKIAEKGR